VAFVCIITGIFLLIYTSVSNNGEKYNFDAPR
jgi:hypothetical protein